MSDSQQQFKLEEFRQLHEHIRAFEAALSTCYTVSLVASTTLITAIFGWFFKSYESDPAKISVTSCYLFLAPGFLGVVALALISSYKTAIFRNGYYIKVFFEEAGEGAQWHINLVQFRKLARDKLYGRFARDEHGNPAAFSIWTLHIISIGLFLLALVLIGRFRIWHLIAPLALIIAMVQQHLAFTSNRELIEGAWHLVQKQTLRPGSASTDDSQAPMAP